MLFDDEKENIDNIENIDDDLLNIEISDSDTVSWENILDDKKDTAEEKPVVEPENQIDTLPEIGADGSINLDETEEIDADTDISDLIEEIASQAPADENILDEDTLPEQEPTLAQIEAMISETAPQNDENVSTDTTDTIQGLQFEDEPEDNKIDLIDDDIDSDEKEQYTAVPTEVVELNDEEDDLFAIAQNTSAPAEKNQEDDDILSSLKEEDDDTDDVSDDELMKILSDGSSPKKSSDNASANEDEIDGILAGSDGEIENEVNSPPVESDETETENSDDGEQEDYDEDSTLTPPEKKKKDSNIAIIVSIVVFIVIVILILRLLLGFVSSKLNAAKDMLMNNAANQLGNQAENMEQNPSDDMYNEDVPVHNEDTLDELKPDENQDTEVVDIIPTGRTNPFLPIDKYVQKTVAKVEFEPFTGKMPKPPVLVSDKVVTETAVVNNIDYNSIKVPKPPTQYGDMSEIATKLMSISVSGIMYDEYKPSAIITMDGNDYFVQIADKLDNFKVVAIGRDYVRIALGKNIYKANIGEPFKIEDGYGISSYYKDKTSTGRQYWSSADEYANRYVNNAKYVSEKDVPIYIK